MHWYCLHTKPRKEESAAIHLRDTLGLETYFPRLKRQQVIRRVKRVVTRPLFPRYLFCRFDASFQYRAVRYASDVIDVVRFGEQPTVVNDAIVAQLKEWAGPALDVISIEPRLQAGDLVEITDGPMRGLQAVVMQERSASDRVAVLLSTLQCQAPVIISRAHLQRAS